jgi:hypothetical protein
VVVKVLTAAGEMEDTSCEPVSKEELVSGSAGARTREYSGFKLYESKTKLMGFRFSSTSEGLTY